MATDIKPLRDQIADASRELKLARRDGSAEWISEGALRRWTFSSTSFLVLPNTARQELPNDQRDRRLQRHHG
jgi:hypothetical protein